MNVINTQVQSNRRLHTWPYLRRNAVFIGHTRRDTNHEMNYESELDLTRYGSLKSIFMTDSSKTIQTNEHNLAVHLTTTAMNTG